MELKDFKNEFRIKCDDTWGDAMDAWFESVGHLYDRGQHIPAKYEYKPSSIPQGCIDEDCYWYPIFLEISVDDLAVIAEFLFRYCSFLRFKGIDY